MATLTLPALGMAVSSTRAGKRAFMGGWHWSEGAPLRRFALISGTAGLLAALGFVWYPNGDYKTIQRGERGTIQGAFAQFGHMKGGRPALTPRREQQLGGASTAQTRSGTTQTGPTATTSPVGGTTTSPTGTTTTGTTTTGTTTNGTTTTGTTTTTPSSTTTAATTAATTTAATTTTP
jgi:hypothetical protein